MLTLREFATTLALVLCSVSDPLRASRAQASHVKTFHSSSGFVISYPASWRRITNSRHMLDIIIGQNRSTGTVIGRQTANITVSRVGISMDSSLDQQMTRWIQDEAIVQDTTITAPAVKRGNCESLRILVTRDEILPGRTARNTRIGCAQSGRAIVVLLSHFDDEASGPSWLSVALEIARSTRWAIR